MTPIESNELTGNWFKSHFKLCFLMFLCQKVSQSTFFKQHNPFRPMSILSHTCSADLDYFWHVIYCLYSVMLVIFSCYGVTNNFLI